MGGSLQKDSHSSSKFLVRSDSKMNTIVKDSYDAVIVGAGIGGLSSASILAREGLSVLVIEQSDRPGGLCKSFKRGQFTFDTAPTKFQGLGELGFSPIRRLLDYLDEQLEITSKPTVHTIYYGGQVITVHTDMNAYTSELAALFPQEAGSIIAFFREMENLYHHVISRSGPPRPREDETFMERLRAFLSHPAGYLSSKKASRISLKSEMSKYSLSEEFKSFLDADIFLRTGMTTDEITAAAGSIALIDHHVGGIYYPLGGTQRIPERLEKSIIENGGEILLRTRVEKILIESEKAYGVEFSDGRTVTTTVIISDIPPDSLLGVTFDKAQIGRESVSGSEKERKPSVFAIYAGIQSSSIPDKFDPNTVIIPDPIRNPGDFVSLNVPSMLDETLVPAGFHSLSIHTLSKHTDWPSPASPEYKAPEYMERKEEETKLAEEKIASVFPGMLDNALCKEVATPATFEIFSGNKNWIFRGAKRQPGAPLALPGAKTRIKGLFLTGSQTIFGGGVANACAAGINAALASLRALERDVPIFVMPKESKLIETIPIRHDVQVLKVVDAMSAVFESQRCLQCENAPCVEACPASIDIPNFLRRTSCGNFAGAALTIREKNPLGAVCGLICPSSQLCEKKCVVDEGTSPVRIREIEAYICSSQRDEMSWPSPPRSRNNHKIAVIGSGPAGISCAYFLSLLGYSVDILEAMIEAGGIPAQILPEFRIDRTVLENDLEGAFLERITFRGNIQFGKEITFESLWREGYRSMFIGTGARHNCDPRIPGSDIPGVIDAISFLTSARRKVKRELSARVAVYGYGRPALDTAIVARNLGAKKVYLITWVNRDDFLDSCGVKKIDDPQVEIIAETTIISAQGNERLEEISLAPGQANPCVQSIERMEDLSVHQVNRLNVGTLIISTPRDIEPTLRGYLASHLTVRTDGTILVDTETMATSINGVFAGGDVIGSSGVAQACADGRKAAISIHRYLTKSL